MLLEISSLIETHVAICKDAFEWLFLGVDPQMSVELGNRPKYLEAWDDTFLIVVLGSVHIWIVTFVKSEHFFLMILFEVVHNELFILRNVLFVA